MNYDRDKLEQMEERLDGFMGALEAARERARLAEANAVTAWVSITRSARMPTPYTPPSRFSGGGQGDFLREYERDPENVIAVFIKESPDHPLLSLMQGHSECRAALNKAQKSLSIHQARVNSLAPVVARCREFLRRVAA